MKKIQIVLFLIIATFMGCSDQSGEGEFAENPCEIGDQGIVMAESNYPNPLYLQFDDSRMVIQYVTGHPDGDYLHMYSVNVSPAIDFDTFAINAGDTSTFDQNFNVTAGSYLAVDGTPYPQSNTLVLNTIIGGSQVGDAIKMEFEGDYGDDPIHIVGELCLTIDEVIGVQDFVYITDGSSLKVVDVSDPYAPSMATTVPLPSSHYVKVINNSVALVGQIDSAEPYVNTINISNPGTSYVMATTAKSSSNTILTDVTTLDNKAVLTDLHFRNKTLEINTNQMVDIGDLHGGFCIANVSDDYLILLDGLGVSTYNIDANYDLTYPFLPSNATFQWTSLVGNRFDRVETDGTYSYIANVEGQKLLKVDVTNSAINQLSSLDIAGHPSALAIYNNYAFVTMSPTGTVPYNAGFDGVKMINLTSMQVVDSSVLSNTSGVVVYGSYAYVTDGNGLHIYDISSGSLNLIATYNPGFGNYISI